MKELLEEKTTVNSLIKFQEINDKLIKSKKNYYLLKPEESEESKKQETDKNAKTNKNAKNREKSLER